MHPVESLANSRVPKSIEKSLRKPLQPKNIQVDHAGITKTCLQKPNLIEISPLAGDTDKENNVMIGTGPLDVSLAEELKAIRHKMERLRWDTEKTERVLRERDMVLDKEMREMEKRGREQREVEMEIDRILRLTVLKDSCLRMHRIQSLREKQQTKNRQAEFQELIHQSAETEKSAEPLQHKLATTA